MTAFIEHRRDRGFAENPPNAALVVHGASRGRDVVVLTISHPHHRPRTHTFTYTAKPVKGTPSEVTSTSSGSDALPRSRYLH
ncbi:hypothetical protein [Solirubrobacter soli]|uniref:hypothetical protein n=1 Tax=Solirubrobacter soli TaxID=363832 RepID=UPI000404B211|nr:hypothetical protein [Solirubrobacter soli]